MYFCDLGILLLLLHFRLNIDYFYECRHLYVCSFCFVLFCFNEPGLVFIVAAVSLTMESSPILEESGWVLSFVITIYKATSDNGL